MISCSVVVIVLRSIFLSPGRPALGEDGGDLRDLMPLTRTGVADVVVVDVSSAAVMAAVIRWSPPADDEDVNAAVAAAAADDDLAVMTLSVTVVCSPRVKVVVFLTTRWVTVLVPVFTFEVRVSDISDDVLFVVW